MDIKQLLGEMSLEDKLGQLSQYAVGCMIDSNGAPLTGPESVLELTDSEYNAVGSVFSYKGAGVMLDMQKKHLGNDSKKIPMLFMQNVIHGYHTIYPIPLAMAASFEPDLMEECCAMAAREAVTEGVHVTFAPMVDLVRDARWGRCAESAGEDPYLNCEMARAQVRGFQGNMDSTKNIAACVKHYAAYGQAEAGRDYNTVELSEHTLREFYLPAYRACIDAGSTMIMPSFNTLNGVPSIVNPWLMKKILKEEWGFNGVVISDYNAIGELENHGITNDPKEAARMAFDCGCDIEMCSTAYCQGLKELVEEGTISVEELDAAVLRVLDLKNKLGLFEDPYRGASPEAEKAVFLTKEHRATARKAAEESAVLLKNDGVLPFAKNVKKIIGKVRV